MCVNNLSKVALDRAAAGIGRSTSSRKSNALTTAPPSHTIISGFYLSHYMFCILWHVWQGKYVEIQFSRGGEPVGGKISNFLLEKVCVVFFLLLRLFPLSSVTVASSPMRRCSFTWNCQPISHCLIELNGTRWDRNLKCLLGFKVTLWSYEIEADFFATD